MDEEEEKVEGDDFKVGDINDDELLDMPLDFGLDEEDPDKDK